MPRSIYLIGYDIGDNGRRRRALKLLRANSEGYQDSVFEVQATPRQISELMEQLHALTDQHMDSAKLTTQLIGQLYKRGVDLVVINQRYENHSFALFADQQKIVDRRCRQYAWQLARISHEGIKRSG